MTLGDPAIQSNALAAARTYFAQLPILGAQSLTHCSMHWAAMPYGWAREQHTAGTRLPYQVVSDRDIDGLPLLIAGMDPALNARTIALDERADSDYCASVWRRNSRGVAVSISAMLDAEPSDFGSAPIDATLVEYMCAGAAALCARYGINPSDPQACFTHAEAACWDGYFWGEDADCRWDLAILDPASADAATLRAAVPVTGDRLRARILVYALALTPS
jgi:hypothetical protein